MQNIVQQVLRQLDVIFSELQNKAAFGDLTYSLFVALQEAVFQLLQRAQLEVGCFSEIGSDAVFVEQQVVRNLVGLEVQFVVVVALQIHDWTACRH